MGAPRTGADPHLAAGPDAANLLDFAIGQVLREDPATDPVPAVLARLVTTFGLRAAVAFQPSATGRPSVLAAYPPSAGDPRGLTQLTRLTRREDSGGLVAYSADRSCAVALLGDMTRRDDEIRPAAHAIATLLATKLRHTAELAEIERSRNALADQTERINCLIATAVPGVVITDENGRITHISQSFGAMFGIERPGRLKGTAAVGTLRWIEGRFADPAEFIQRAGEIYRAKKPRSGEQIMAADGRTIECDYWPVFVDGRHRGDLWLLWDRSDRTEVEREHEEQNARLRQLDEARNQFVAMVSHELRTPLTSIVSFSELIRSEAGNLTSDGVRFLDVIVRNADRLLRLIDDLLLLSRLEAGVLPLDLTPVSVPGLVVEAAKNASGIAASQGISIDVTTGTGPLMLGDARRLQQVLDNLISNAVKFSHLNERVRVTTSYGDGTWRIDIADSGIGIPPGEAARLFGRFVRASNARTAGLPGTGLGLSIVKVIVEMHGGHVEVHTALRRGTTFTVFLPAAS